MESKYAQNIVYKEVIRHNKKNGWDNNERSNLFSSAIPTTYYSWFENEK